MVTLIGIEDEVREVYNCSLYKMNLFLRNGFEMGGLVECLRWPSNMFSGNLSNFITKICRQAGVALMMRLKKIHKCSLFKKGIVW